MQFNVCMKRFLPFLLVIWSLEGLAQIEGEDYFLLSIYFGGGSFYIDEQGAQDLYEFLDAIENIENYSISIHGHTDNIGGVAYNEWLAEMRSETVIQLMEMHEIDREMITKKDFGLFNPLYDNSTWQGRELNRRVDIILWPISM